jgi:adenine-specific DNA-methyltransferase
MARTETNKGKPGNSSGNGKRVTRYTFNEIKEPRMPETGHTALMPADEQIVTLPMDNGWSKAIQVGKLPGKDNPVVVDMDPAVDPVLFWAGKRSRRKISLLPLQRNDIVSDSRIAQIVDRARKAAEEESPQMSMGAILAQLEKTFRESEKSKRVEFYTHDEGWKNKLICGDSMQVVESLLQYEALRRSVQMIYIDPPYGIKYDSNFQQRVDSTKNDEKNSADDVLTIRAFHDTWTLGIHSYLSYLQELLYLSRDLLTETGSIFVQMGDDNAHLARAVLDEVFGKANFMSEVVFYKTSGKGGVGLDAVFDRLLWYANDKSRVKYRKLYMPRPTYTLQEQYTSVELRDGTIRRITNEENVGVTPLPSGARRFKVADLSSQGESEGGSKPFEFDRVKYELPANTHWKTTQEGLQRLSEKGRLYPIGKRLYYKRFADDFPLAPFTNIWEDTVISGFAEPKLYAVQTSPKVVERCVLMTTDPGELVFDPTGGSGTTAYCAEKFGRRWITCDASRVSVNVTRKRLLSGVFEHFKTRNGIVSGGFLNKVMKRVTLKSLAYDQEPETIELFDQPQVDPNAIRVCGPFEVMSIGRYSVEDWTGYVVVPGNGMEPAKLENYIEVICRLYRTNAAIQGASGLVHAIAESKDEKIAISVGPLSGRVTGKQVNDAVQDAISSGILEIHLLGWAFEANVGEVKAQLERRGKVKIQFIMIRPDTLADGLRLVDRALLFSPLAMPDISITREKSGTQPSAVVTVKGIAMFDRKTRTTEYKQANSGYISAWYLDEDYDGDCFVDCQMFFDFKKAPNLKGLGVAAEAKSFQMPFESEPFKVRGYKRIALKVVDVYGNESTVVRDLA